MDTKGRHIILGSNSPRRRELLAGLNVDFTVDTGNTFIETYDPQTPHERIPEVLSEGKSYGFHRELSENEILITSDTLVLCEGRVMGKPHSYEEAFEMLRWLSGRGHKVITAVTIRDCSRTVTCSDVATVHFKELTDAEIKYYIDTFKPYDKAGAYGIQGFGATLVKEIHGDYFNIVGLPVARLKKEIENFRKIWDLYE